MIAKNKALVVDIDGTLCDIKGKGESYADVAPEPRMVARMREMHAQGWRIILSSARGMRSNDGNMGQINKVVTPVLLEWLACHDIPYDELHMAKPWPGSDGVYIDDRAVRPREFLENDQSGIDALIARDRIAGDGNSGDGA
jgi:capsule biosynthesis phosphatase